MFGGREAKGFENVPGLAHALGRVTRLPAVPFANGASKRRVVLGFDMGSTGSKLLAVDAAAKQPVWEGYVNTLGDPVAAARKLADMFLNETSALHDVVAIGATGSGREIVGSLMSSCFGAGPVFVLNEIAAHAAGALFFDDQVDTIFEIGGQDAKYIRLDGGRICDAAMNEACSAGTVVQMGKIAVGSDCGVSLGQHCSVFMAEVIDDAVAAGVPQPHIIAGIYDSIIQNYLNRVKGNRSVGSRIFCQGMPFMADALAAAVARQTGQTVVIPPNPGTIGALGIALLTLDEIDVSGREALAIERFLTARVDRKDVFVCKSHKGCGAPGNKCKIDRIRTVVDGKQHKFVWGGNCSLFDGGTNRRKLPDMSPDPFRQRDALMLQILEEHGGPGGGQRVAMTEEFALKGLLPFFATFVRRLGFDTTIYSEGTHAELKRGIEGANVPYCAPMQVYQGVLAKMLADQPEWLLAPRLRELPRQADEPHAVTCPVVQASPDILTAAMTADCPTKLVTTRIDIGPGNLASQRFRDSAARLAADLGAVAGFELAFAAACRAQRAFDDGCMELGRRALEFAKQNELVAVVVLGRSYTIHNTVLNSNVPDILREQGAIAIPVDCYPIDADTPVFDDLYWGYGQLNIRASHQIRRTEGVYPVFCSNYSCGPDSFNLHFFSYTMENKPFAIIETDGHSGDAGTKTRIEAFLYCVEGDRRLARAEREAKARTSFAAIEADKIRVGEALSRDSKILIPRMGPGAEVVAQLFAAEGARAETLPMPTRESLRIGRRVTSGKECVPMAITMGSLLERLEQDRDTDEQFTFLMPTANGPCRFGVYNLLHKILIEKAGWKDRVRVASAADADYFDRLSPDFEVRACVAFMGADLLLAALHDVRPAENQPGQAQEIYDRYFGELLKLARNAKPRPMLRALSELTNGCFGVRDLIRRAAREFRAAKNFAIDLPTVSVVGEIYVRLDPFANDFLVDKLEQRGMRVMLAPFSEWLEYMTHLKLQRLEEDRGLPADNKLKAAFTYAVQNGVADKLYGDMVAALGWGERTTVSASLSAASRYISPELMGEAVLTLGGPLHEYLHGAIDGVVAVGPHECMPNKIAEAQFAHVGEDHGLVSLALPVNGDPIDAEILDRFAFEVKQQHRARGTRAQVAPVIEGRIPGAAILDRIPSSLFRLGWMWAKHARKTRTVLAVPSPAPDVPIERLVRPRARRGRDARS